MSVSDKYPELTRQFFLLDEIQKALSNHPMYDRLVKHPEQDCEFFKRITDETFVLAWQTNNMIPCDPNKPGEAAVKNIVLGSNIVPSLRLQKFFHPSTLPDQISGDFWLHFKQSKKEVDAFIQEVQRLQNYSRNATSKKRCYYYCEYSNRNKKKNVKISNKTGC